MSEGDFLNMRPHLDSKSDKQFDESTDTYDTIDWLVREVPRNNGRVGQWGFLTPASILLPAPSIPIQLSRQFRRKRLSQTGSSMTSIEMALSF